MGTCGLNWHGGARWKAKEGEDLRGQITSEDERGLGRCITREDEDFFRTGKQRRRHLCWNKKVRERKVGT